jgi:hypothetical protein
MDEPLPVTACEFSRVDREAHSVEMIDGQMHVLFIILAADH